MTIALVLPGTYEVPQHHIVSVSAGAVKLFCGRSAS